MRTAGRGARAGLLRAAVDGAAGFDATGFDTADAGADARLSFATVAAVAGGSGVVGGDAGGAISAEGFVAGARAAGLAVAAAGAAALSAAAAGAGADLLRRASTVPMAASATTAAAARPNIRERGEARLSGKSWSVSTEALWLALLSLPAGAAFSSGTGPVSFVLSARVCGPSGAA